MDKESDALRKYIQGAWFIKIRLISSRRQLWGPNISLIHCENAALQFRKICEMLADICISIAEYDGFKPPKSLKPWQVGKVFKYLQKNSILKFPQISRLEKSVAQPDSTWIMNIEPLNDGDVDRIERIHERTHLLLHEYSPLEEFPVAEDARQALPALVNALRADHQWLWNRLWQHAFLIDGKILFINFGDHSNSSKPQVIKHEDIHKGQLEVDFDPQLLADFSCPIDWTKFDG